jgi:asparagine synthase (glutamine-hydrolysing)
MTKKLSLRGPDDYGIFIDPDAKIQLGQTRLSIIDLSNKGHQPMHYLNGKYTIVFNGEIYNFLTIKFELENLGYKFNTESDTEVILAAYDYWNQDCLLKFNGMFAFAIWDNFKKEMFIARDRFGIKPLIYFFNSCGFMFSSEIKAILESNLIPKKINKHAMFDFFSYGSVCQPNTIIENVKALLPGHFIKVIK